MHYIVKPKILSKWNMLIYNLKRKEFTFMTHYYINLFLYNFNSLAAFKVKYIIYLIQYLYYIIYI